MTVWDNCGLYDYDYTVVHVADFGMSVADPIVRVGDVTAVTIWADTPSSTRTTLSFSASNLTYCRLWLDQARTQPLTNPSWQLTGGYFQTSFYLEPITWYTGQLYAGLATPGWDGSSEYGCCQVQFGAVQILEPDGDPNTDNNFVFNSATPGVSQVMATGMSGKPACDPNLEWAISGISGSVLTSSRSPPRGNWIIFSYTGLPSSNSAFGPKTLTLRDLGCTDLPAQYREDTQQVEIFFNGTDSATNHPGPGSGITPNWFYYWLQTEAGFETANYDPTSFMSYSTWVNGRWVIYLGTSANDPYTPPPGGDNEGNLLDGIDHFAWVMRHEAKHCQLGNGWFPDDYDDSDDPDGDAIPTRYEVLLVPGGPYDPNNPDTDGDGLEDIDDYVIATQTPWKEGDADSEDWSDYGHQWNR